MLTSASNKPTRQETYAAAVCVAETLGQRIAFAYKAAYHFRLEDGWSLSLSADDAGRFRLDACRWTEPRSTLWALADDHERLAALASEMVAEIEYALAA